jgi:hypothetical protein
MKQRRPSLEMIEPTASIVYSSSMRPKLLPDPVHKELHAPAPGADIHVELLALDEQFTDVPQDAKSGTLMESLGADIVQILCASGAHDRIRFLVHLSFLSRQSNS